MRLGAQKFGEVMAGLQSALPDGSGRERRMARRISIVARVPVLRLTSAGERHVYTALTRDLSFTGICLLQSESASDDDRLVVRLPCGRHSPPILLVCQVRNCRSLADGLFAIGAEFTGELGKDLSVIPRDEGYERKIQRIRQSILGEKAP